MYFSYSGYWQHFSKLDNTLINKYDTDSILHWGTNAFCNDRSHHTVTSKNSSIQIGQREKLSDMDVERLQILYEAKTPVSTYFIYQWSQYSAWWCMLENTGLLIINIWPSYMQSCILCRMCVQISHHLTYFQSLLPICGG